MPMPRIRDAVNLHRSGVIGILFTPRMMDSPPPPRVFTDFWTCTYAALD